MPDARYWSGDDARDFDMDDDERCEVCGVGPHELCDVTCDCTYCQGRRAREAALRVLDVEPESAA